ncbi:hypothetical protein F4814DRAFT_450353 [Daldinia grandis]|nr:hypothetical protein F4814DRAFT_450353 [Daldinia grandis]
MAGQVTGIGIESIPTEIIIEIFTSLESASEVRSLFLTCKKFYAIYADISHHIAKALIVRQLGPDDYKLAVMVIESRRVNFQDKAELWQFYDDYYAEGEWDIKLFRMQTAFHLPKLQEENEHILETDPELGMWEWIHYDFIPEPGAGHAEKIRALNKRQLCINRGIWAHPDLHVEYVFSQCGIKPN